MLKYSIWIINNELSSFVLCLMKTKPNKKLYLNKFYCDVQTISTLFPVYIRARCKSSFFLRISPSNDFIFMMFNFHYDQFQPERVNLS